MKTLKFTFLFTLLALVSLSKAQETQPRYDRGDPEKNLRNSPWIFGIGWNVVDDNGDPYSGLFDVKDSWNVPAFPSTLRVEKYWTKGVSLYLNGAYNKYNVGKRINSENPSTYESTFWNVDLMAKYNFCHLYNINTKLFNFNRDVFDIYAAVGTGYTSRNPFPLPSVMTANVGGGMHIWALPFFGFNIETTGKFGLNSPAFNTYTNYAQLNLGVVFQLGSGKSKKVKEPEPVVTPPTPTAQKDPECGAAPSETLEITTTDKGDGIYIFDMNSKGTEALKGTKFLWKVNGIVVDSAKQSDYTFEESGTYTISAQMIGKCDTCKNASAVCNEVSLNVYEYVNLNLSPEELKALTWDEGQLLFIYNTSTLTKESKARLDRNVQVLKNNPELLIAISGYADSRGDAAFNQKLSLQRANIVRRYMALRGIKKEQIILVEGCGETNIINSCFDGVFCTPEQHAVNRRVEINLMNKIPE